MPAFARSLTGPGAFRLLLAALVFVSHVSALNVGRAAVVLFFMLSGYWVTRLYMTRGDQSVFGYLGDRLLRVWPLLAVVALAVSAAYALVGHAYTGSLASTLGLLGLATRQGDILGITWSLDIELQFYLVLPAALAVLMAPRLRNPLVAIALLALATLIGVALLSQGIITVFAYTPAFAAGAAIWILAWSPGARTAIASVALFALIVLITAAVPGLRWIIILKQQFPWWNDLLQVALCMVLLPFVAWNVHQPSPPLDRHLGNLSFPLYLVHFPVIVLTVGLTSSALANKGAALVISVVATLVLYVFVDRRLERWRKTRMHRRGDALA